MERREMMRVLAGTVMSGLAGCAVPVVRREDESAVYEIPGRAVDHLRRFARGGYACWQGGGMVSSSGTGGTFPVLSVTKTIAALTTARAVTNGWCTLDEVVNFPEWGARRAVTPRHLLNSSAGIAPGDREMYSQHPLDKGRAALRLPASRPPGSAFQYGPASWELLGEFLKRRFPAHGTTLADSLWGTVSKLGIRPADWRRDGNGTPYLSTGLVCGLSDLGHLGSVLVDLVSGRGRIGISAEAFGDLTSPRSANPMFSAGIWWNRLARRRGAHSVEPERVLNGVKSPAFWQNACLFPAARPDWLALVGSGGTRVYVLPSASVVIATARAGNRWSDAAMLRELTGSGG